MVDFFLVEIRREVEFMVVKSPVVVVVREVAAEGHDSPGRDDALVVGPGDDVGVVGVVVAADATTMLVLHLFCDKFVVALGAGHFRPR